MIEFIAALVFITTLIVGRIVSVRESRKRAAEAAEEAKKPRTNWVLVDARRLGSPL